MHRPRPCPLNVGILTAALCLVGCGTTTMDDGDASTSSFRGEGGNGTYDAAGPYAIGGHGGQEAGAQGRGGYGGADGGSRQLGGGRSSEEAGLQQGGNGRAGADGSTPSAGGTSGVAGGSPVRDGGHSEEGAAPHGDANATSDATGALDAPDGASPRRDGGEPVRLAIPLYIWPGDGSEWSKVAAAGSTVSYIIANAGDPGGPGPSADRAYTEAIDNAHRAGQRVVGYVDTSYAERELGKVQSEIDQWYGFYPAVDGIFLDLTPSGADRIADYYRPASDQVRSKPGAHVVIINPGQPEFDERYMDLADIAMSYENPYGSSSDGYAPGKFEAPTWTTRYAAERFWHVILEVPDKASMQNVLDLARTRNVGHVYITNYPDPPAYARLPVYFTDEVTALVR